MLKKILFVALCTAAPQGFAAQSLETGAVVCNDVNAIRHAHAVASSNIPATMPSECVQTRDKVMLVSYSMLGQLARIEVETNGNVQQMWTLPLYIKE